MAGTTRVVTFSEGVSVSAPSQAFLVASSLQTYVNDAAFDSAKGSPAVEGDIYGNSTDGEVRYRGTSGFDSLVNLTGSQSLANKTIDANSNTVTNLVHGAEVDNPTVAHGATGAVVGTTNTQTLTAKTFDDAVTQQEITTPSTPATGYQKIYPKADGSYYHLDDAGVETAFAGGAVPIIPAFRAYVASYTVGADVYLNVPITEDFDAASNYTNSPSNLYTVGTGEAGSHHFAFTTEITRTGTSGFGIIYGISVNDSDILVSRQGVAGDVTSFSASGSVTLDLADADTVSFRCRGGSVNTTFDYLNFSGHRVGDS